MGLVAVDGIARVQQKPIFFVCSGHECGSMMAMSVANVCTFGSFDHYAVCHASMLVVVVVVVMREDASIPLNS